MDGFRLGYGGGYYDRFLSTLEKKPPTIGLSFELQLVDEFPVEDFDIPVDFILTEKRLIEARKNDYNPMEWKHRVVRFDDGIFNPSDSLDPVLLPQ